MPMGIIAMEWDERTGVNVIGSYPEEIQLDDKTLMQVYSTHEFTGEAGMISLAKGASNIASYYTGPEHGLYVILLLNVDEDPDAYEEGLAETARHIVQNRDPESFRRIIPGLFQRLSIYPSLNDEQRLFMIYDDEIKRLVLKRLEEEGAILKSELMVWFRDQYQEGFVDLDNVLEAFVKLNLIKQVSVKGSHGLVIFLVEDILINRAPPVKLLKDPVDRGLPEPLKEDYVVDVRAFFQNYTPSEEDNIRVVRAALDPQVYEVLKLLRNAIVTRDVLEKLKKKGVDDVEGTLKKLWDADMLSVLQDERGNEYYALKTDVVARKIFPEFSVNTIRADYRQNLKNKNVLLEYLNLLEDMYPVWEQENKEFQKKMMAEVEEVE